MEAAADHCSRLAARLPSPGAHVLPSVPQTGTAWQKQPSRYSLAAGCASIIMHLCWAGVSLLTTTRTAPTPPVLQRPTPIETRGTTQKLLKHE
jgi:hypothetical protein